MTQDVLHYAALRYGAARTADLTGQQMKAIRCLPQAKRKVRLKEQSRRRWQKRSNDLQTYISRQTHEVLEKRCQEMEAPGQRSMAA
jgi:uncharacterized protein YdaU (DUF1376 family)